MTWHHYNDQYSCLQRSYETVMFSVVSVILLGGGSHVTITALGPLSPAIHQTWDPLATATPQHLLPGHQTCDPCQYWWHLLFKIAYFYTHPTTLFEILFTPSVGVDVSVDALVSVWNTFSSIYASVTSDVWCEWYKYKSDIFLNGNMTPLLFTNWNACYLL